MIALFENCSSTSEEKRAPVKSLELSSSCERVYQLILDDAKAKDYYGLKTKREFFEIYYWKAGFEISISLVHSTQGSKTYLNMMVYGEKKRGRTRKMLRNSLEYYKNLLKDLSV